MARRHTLSILLLLIATIISTTQSVIITRTVDGDIIEFKNGGGIDSCPDGIKSAQIATSDKAKTIEHGIRISSPHKNDKFLMNTRYNGQTQNSSTQTCTCDSTLMSQSDADKKLKCFTDYIKRKYYTFAFICFNNILVNLLSFLQ